MDMRRSGLALAALLLAATAYPAQMTLEQQLGRKLFNDIGLSVNRNQACTSCHADEPVLVPSELPTGKAVLKHQPVAPMADPAGVQHWAPVSDGSQYRVYTTLNALRNSYAAFNPPMEWQSDDFVGGLLWNGRAQSIEEVARGVFMDPYEYAQPDAWSFVRLLREDWVYQWFFMEVYGLDLEAINEGHPQVIEAYNAAGSAIAAYMRSARFHRFDSKFDFVMAGITEFTELERTGFRLFIDDAGCINCHLVDEYEYGGYSGPALLTDYKYYNLGVPANPLIPGDPPVNPGLLGNPNIEAIRGAPSPAEEVEGRHKTPSLRNVELTAPYMHNGVLKTLKEAVNFISTRDVLSDCVDPADATNPGFGVTCWPPGEFEETKNIGDTGSITLGPSGAAALVAFLKTLTDNYPEWGNSNGLHDPNVPPGTPSPYPDLIIPDLSGED